MDTGAEYYQMFLNGSNAGIEKIILEYRAGLQAYLHSVTHDMTLAEEMTQETFVKIFTTRPKYYAKASFKTWLYTVARNLTLNALRKRNREIRLAALEKEPNGYTESPEGLYESTEKTRAVRGALSKIKPEYAEVLWLTYFEDLSSREIARVINKTAHNVDVMRERAKKMLKEQLRKDGFADEIQ